MTKKLLLVDNDQGLPQAMYYTMDDKTKDYTPASISYVHPDNYLSQRGFNFKYFYIPNTWEELTEALRETYGKDERYIFKVNETNGDIYIDVDNEKLKASLTLTKNNHGLCDSEWLVTYNRTCSQLFNIVVSMLEINKGE
jgi:hypothetical protein